MPSNATSFINIGFTSVVIVTGSTSIIVTMTKYEMRNTNDIDECAICDTRCDGKVQCPNPMDHVNRAELEVGNRICMVTHNAQQNKKIGPVNAQVPTHLWEVGIR